MSLMTTSTKYKASLKPASWGRDHAVAADPEFACTPIQPLFP